MWTNFVRGSLKTDEELTLLDSVKGDGTQFAGVLASSYCSTFANNTVTLCGSGCSPLPNDYETNWQVNQLSCCFIALATMCNYKRITHGCGFELGLVTMRF